MKEELSGADLLLANDLEYTRERIVHTNFVKGTYEADLKRLIRKALARNWSLKRIATYSGVEKPVIWAKSK